MTGVFIVAELNALDRRSIQVRNDEYILFAEATHDLNFTTTGKPSTDLKFTIRMFNFKRFQTSVHAKPSPNY